MNTAPSSSSEASSSSRSNTSNTADNNHAHHASVADEPDLLGGDNDADDNDTSVFESDPLSLNLDSQTPLSFKRKQKQSILSQPARLFTALTGGGTSSPSRTSPPLYDDAAAHPLSPVSGLNPAAKDANPLDWYVEDPGRRVGYEDMTAIDWIFEYTKERQRLRVLRSSARGLLGYAARFADASQVWVVLVLTGLAAGALAAGIDVTSNWLGDLKGGYCSSVESGAFYLNKGFCCMGYDTPEQCRGWKPWSVALGIGSAGGKWFIEYFFFVMWSVTFALAASVLVQEYAIYAKHSGIPEIKTVLGGFIIRRFMGTWTLVTKSLGLCLAVASGMWLGKEGPLVHVACCCANLFIKLFPTINNNEARKREVLSAAAASGISVAFGSPIGGVLFSLEQLSYYFPDKTMWQSFVCAMTAAVTLQALDPFRSGKLVLYQVKYSTGWHGFELVPFCLLGILGGLYGGLFIKANMRVAEWKRAHASRLPGPVAQVAAVALLTALINYPNHYMRAQTSELVSYLFEECSRVTVDEFGLCKTGAATAATIVLLVFASVLGFFLASATFGLQIPAGIILPSMAIGALSGRAVGIVMEILVAAHPNFLPFTSCEPDIPCVTPGTYAIIGAAATLAGVTRMTVSIVVIMFELTGALTYVLPIMIAVMLSKWVGDAFSRRGIYESWIQFSGYPYLDNNDEVPPSSAPSSGGGVLLSDVPVSHFMTRTEDLVVLTASGHTLASLASVLESHPYRGFPVVSDPRRAVLLGYISRAELAYNLAAASRPPRSLPPDAEVFFSQPPSDESSEAASLDLRPWMDRTPLTLPSSAPLHRAVAYFQKLGLRYLLLVDRGQLQGLLTKKDVWYVLNGAGEETTRRPAVARDRGGGGGGGGSTGLGIGNMAMDGHEEGVLGADQDVGEGPGAGETGSIL